MDAAIILKVSPVFLKGGIMNIFIQEILNEYYDAGPMLKTALKLQYSEAIKQEDIEDWQYINNKELGW